MREERKNRLMNLNLQLAAPSVTFLSRLAVNPPTWTILSFLLTSSVGQWIFFCFDQCTAGNEDSSEDIQLEIFGSYSSRKLKKNLKNLRKGSELCFVFVFLNRCVNTALS